MRAHPLHVALLRVVEQPLELAVDVGVDRHAAMARVDLDPLGCGIEARPPVDDRVAARVHRDRRRCPSRQRRREQRRGTPRSRRRPALVENSPRQPEVAEPRHPAHCAQHRRRTPRADRDRRPEHHQPARRSGWRTASARASVPPRLWPIRRPRGSSRTLRGRASSRSSSRPAHPTLARMPLVVHSWPRRREPAGEHGQRGVAGHEARDQQDRLPAVALLRRGGGGRAGAQKRVSVSSRPNSGQNRSSYPSGALTPGPRPAAG